MKKICSRCKVTELQEEGRNALSRKDNETEICSDCGTREALEAFEEFLKNDDEEVEGADWRYRL